MDWLNMDVSSNLAFVSGIRSCISRVAYNFGFDDRQAYHIEMIVDEICSNAIEYGSRDKNSRIKLECKFYKDRMELVVSDYGGKKFDVEAVLKKGNSLISTKFDKNNLPKPSRGRGLILVKKLADRFEIKVSKVGTKVTVVKKKKSP